MTTQRTIWTIAGAAVCIAIAGYFVRHSLIGDADVRIPSSRHERDQLVSELLSGLEMDHRVRRPRTRELVDRVSAYCEDPALSSAETYYALGLRKYYGELDTLAAEDAFTEASRLRRDWAWPVNGQGIVQFVAGRRDEALESFHKALTMEPGWSRPHTDMAILYRRAGEMATAIEHAEQALAIEPEHPVNQYNYAVILDELGRHDEARERYLRVVELTKEMPQALYNLACGYARERDVARSLDYLREAVAAEPMFKSDARDDPDLAALRENSEFRAITNAAASEPTAQ